jgi:ABC-type multidrug transport system ATPase subunit
VFLYDYYSLSLYFIYKKNNFMSVLKLNALTKSYGKIKAVSNLSLSIEQGSVYGLLGPNGSGKTTTLGMILGVLTQDSGTFQWFDDKYGEAHRKRIGTLLETPNFFPYLNAIDNLRIVAEIKGIAEVDMDHLLHIVNLTGRKKDKFNQYSLGMKQRLAIASALLGDPEVLIFDEPTNGLDPVGISDVREIIKNIAREGKTIIMASHILDEVEKICSHVGIMQKGHLIANGPIGQIINDDFIGEIGCEDLEKLATLIDNIEGIQLLKKHATYLECTVSKALNAKDINKMLYNQGVVLSHLVLRKQSLEEEFLKLITAKN